MRIITNIRGHLLAFGGQKTNTFMAAATKVFVSSVWLLLLNMGTGVLVARFIGPEGRGEQAAMILWPQFLAYTMTLGIPSSLVYYYKKNREHASSYFAISILLSIVLGIAAATIGVFLIPHLLSGYSPAIVLFAQISMIICPIALLSTFMGSALQAYNNYRLLNLSKTSGPFITLLLILLLILFDRMTPTYTALAYLVSGFPVACLVFFVLYKELKVTFSTLKQRYKELFGYGIRAYAIDLLGAISTQLDQILVVAMLTPTQMGYYAVALALSKLPKIVQTTITTVLFPKASGNDDKKVLDMTLISFRIGLCITAICCIGAFFISPTAIRILYGPEFLGAVAALQILLIREIVASGSSILMQYFMAKGKPGLVSVVEGAGIVSNIPLMLWLLPLYGLPGIASALLVTSIVRLILVIVIIKRSHSEKLAFVINKTDIAKLRFELNKVRNKLKRRGSDM